MLALQRLDCRLFLFLMATAKRPSSASSMDEPASYPVSSLAGFHRCLLLARRRQRQRHLRPATYT